MPQKKKELRAMKSLSFTYSKESKNKLPGQMINHKFMQHSCHQDRDYRTAF